MNNEKELRHRYGWTPAPTKPAYSQTNVNLEYNGRDIESLMRYHKAHLKGRTDDDCLAEKFGSGESGKNVSGDTPRAATMPTGACRPPVCPAPTPPPQQSADDLYEPVGTLPVVGDTVVQTDERIGPQINHTLIEAYGEGSFKDERGLAWGPGAGWDTVRVLKRKPAVQTVAARAWKCSKTYGASVGGREFVKEYGAWVSCNYNESPYKSLLDWAERKRGVELHGPERDAIIAECCAAMNLDPTTGEPLHA